MTDNRKVYSKEFKQKAIDAVRWEEKCVKSRMNSESGRDCLTLGVLSFAADQVKMERAGTMPLPKDSQKH
jgi:hypothetical protein